MSKATPRYNCIAFVVGDERHWWEGECNGGRYGWFLGLPRKTDVKTLVRAFTERGYELTDNRNIEPGYEKVAIYVNADDLEFSHIAHSDGVVWKSKLGKGQDIHHYSLDVLEGDEIDEYGIVDKVLRKPIG
jgi:hypothetical protein